MIGGTVATAGGPAGAAGSFVFGELCTGRLMQLRPLGDGWAAYDLGARLAYLTSVAADSQGNVIVTSLNGGVYRVVPA